MGPSRSHMRLRQGTALLPIDGEIEFREQHSELSDKIVD